MGADRELEQRCHKITEKAVLMFVVNVPQFFLSHRLPLAIAASSAGFTVHVATGAGSGYDQIIKHGFTHHLLPLTRSGANPLKELRCLWALYHLIRKVKPDLMHLVTIKPVIYGGVIARLTGVSGVVAAISGLGTVFVAGKGLRMWLRFMAIWLYRLALKHPNLKAIFQNPDDCSALVNLQVINKKQSQLIRGSGVSLTEFTRHPEPDGIPTISLASRLLRDKGVMEFIAAIRILNKRGVKAQYWLIGSPDPCNLSSITNHDIAKWQNEGLINPLGQRSDIAALFQKSNIVVLPSYREGLPKVLIEAAASGRAIITTDAPGCRHAIEPEKTGLLVPIRCASALADAIETLIKNPSRRQKMGIAGRSLAEREFSIDKVIEAHLLIYKNLIKESVIS